MSVKIPLDSYDTEKKLAPTQENFPALKHFFKFKEVTTPSINTHDYADSIGNVVLRPASANTCDGVKLSSFIQSGNNNVRSGAWESPVGKEPLIMFLATTNGGTDIVCHIGSTDAGTTRVRCSTNVNTIHDGTTPCPNATLPTKRVLAMYAHYFNKDSLTAGTNTVEVDAAGTTVSSGGDGTALTMTAMGAATWIDLTSDIYGIAVFMFDKVPGDVALAAQWMRLRWLAGEKVIWPGWKDLL